MTTADERMARAYASALRANAALLIAWKGSLSAERRAELAAFEAKGLRLGLTLTIPERTWIFSVILLDPAGGIVVLETLEASLGGASTSTN